MHFYKKHICQFSFLMLAEQNAKNMSLVLQLFGVFVCRFFLYSLNE